MKYYSGYDVLNIEPKDVTSHSEWKWQQKGCSIFFGKQYARYKKGLSRSHRRKLMRQVGDKGLTEEMFKKCMDNLWQRIAIPAPSVMLVSQAYFDALPNEAENN
jgi:hypothetical protein